MRQVTNAGGYIVLARSYDPYGNNNLDNGPASTSYGFTGEYTEPTGDIYLRARHCSPGTGRFISRDTWDGDINKPLSLNRWNYTDSNPINSIDPSGNKYIDPTGKSICSEPLPYFCTDSLIKLHSVAEQTKRTVKVGSLQPVEAFAQFADSSKNVFLANPINCMSFSVRDMMWAMTIILDDMDANRGSIWSQATKSPFGNTVGYQGAGSGYFIGQDWLPYRNNPNHDSDHYEPTKGRWCDPFNKDDCDHAKWVHSLRGDWNEQYWDKTANQAFHFWFFVAVAFFDGAAYAHAGDWFHDYRSGITTYDFIHSDPMQPPPPSHIPSQPDINITRKAIALGVSLRMSEFSSSPPENVGSWIRMNLK